MKTNIVKDNTIIGWAIDSDPENHPAYPMKQTEGGEAEDLYWLTPYQQPVDIEVLRSIERPDMTAVFGTSTPPSGLSGSIRRFAFKYSESSWLHWVPLLLADRVNMLEGILHDFSRGHIPNIFSE